QPRRSQRGRDRRRARGAHRRRARVLDDAGRARPGVRMTSAPRPYVLVAELTYRCPLRCAYCSNPSEGAPGVALDSDDWLRVLAEAEALGVVQVHFTGGEPLLRDDLEALIERARALDLYSNLITSGLPLDEARLGRLRALGLDALQLSFQSARPGSST